MAIPRLLQPRRGRIFIAVGDVVPQLTADECGKEPTGVGRANDPGVFGGGQEGQLVTVAWANQPVPLCLLEEGEEPYRITQVIGDDVLEGGRQGGTRGLVFALLLNTSGCARSGCCGWERHGWR